MESLEQVIPEAPQGPGAPPTLRAHVVQMLSAGILSGKYTDAAHPPAGSRGAGGYREMMEDYLTQPVLDAVQKLVPLAKEAGCSMTQLALAWCLRQPAVTSTIVGATKIEHVDDNVAAGDLNLDPKLFERMNAILKPILPKDRKSVV